MDSIQEFMESCNSHDNTNCSLSNTTSNSLIVGGSSPSASVTTTSSRYENQKRRDWNTFGQYLKNHRPPLSLSRCSGAHVLEFLRYTHTLPCCLALLSPYLDPACLEIFWKLIVKLKSILRRGRRSFSEYFLCFKIDSVKKQATEQNMLLIFPIFTCSQLIFQFIWKSFYINFKLKLFLDWRFCKYLMNIY